MRKPGLKWIALVLSALLLSSLAAAVMTELSHDPETPHETVSAENGEWFCPMHDHVRSDHEGSCPICGMKLVRRSQTLEAAHPDQFYVAPQVQERTGVVLETIERVEFRPTFEVAAQVVSDEQRAVTLSPKVAGWIQRLGVSVPGQIVRKGQMLYEIYSPELQQRQRDYLDLLTRRDSLLATKRGQNGIPVGNVQPEPMLASIARERYRARNRLLAADVPPDILEDLERFRRVHEVVPIRAGYDGIVTRIGARQGAYVSPGEVVVAMADREAAWAELSMNPERLAQLGSGDELELRSTVDASVLVVSPLDSSLAIVDPASRTARLRVPLPPSGNSFLPGTLLQARILMKARQAVTLAHDTVLRTGRGAFVIVAEGENHFSQRAVQLGAESGDRVEVLSGVQAGERVVVNGQFMLSAEGSLQSSWRRLAAQRASTTERSGMHAHEHAEHSHEHAEDSPAHAEQQPHSHEEHAHLAH